MYKVITAFAKAISVAGEHKNIEPVVYHFDRARNRQRAAVQTFKRRQFCKVYNMAMTSDAGYYNRV